MVEATLALVFATACCLTPVLGTVDLVTVLAPDQTSALYDMYEALGGNATAALATWDFSSDSDPCIDLLTGYLRVIDPWLGLVCEVDPVRVV